MGYTHYWRRKEKYKKETMDLVVRDLKEVVAFLEPVVPLAGGLGEGKATISRELICFNGPRGCGHENRNLGITWPDKEAYGISLAYEKGEALSKGTILTVLSGEQESLTLKDGDVAGKWFAGAKLRARTCGGDCSHETFYFPRLLRDIPAWQEPEEGLYFSFCKTAYKPYDTTVTAALIILKNYLGDEIQILSDGDLKDWSEAMMICRAVLGYGMKFQLDRGGDDETDNE